MSQRIVDEAFVRELEAEQHASTADEHFSSVEGVAAGASDFSPQSTRIGGLRGFVWRLIQPLLAPIFEKQRILDRAHLDVSRQAWAELHAEQAVLRRLIARAYTKTGESLGKLRDSVLSHIDSRIAELQAEQRHAVEAAVTAESEQRREEVRREMRSLGQDLVARSDRLIAHLENQVEALERDITRHSANSTAHLDQFRAVLRDVTSESAVQRSRIALLSGEWNSGNAGKTGTAGDRSIILDWLRDCGPVLDIACGAGGLLSMLHAAGIECRGLEKSPELAGRGRECGLEITTGPYPEIIQTLPTAAYGALHCAEPVAVFGLEGMRAILPEFSRLLRPGGIVVFTVGNSQSLSGVVRLTTAPFADSAVTPHELAELLAAEGFTDVGVHPGSAARQRLAVPESRAALPREIESAFARIDRNFEELDALLFGPESFLVVART